MIQTGLLALVVLLLGYHMFLGGHEHTATTDGTASAAVAPVDAKAAARQQLAATNPTATPNKPAEPAKPVGPTTTLQWNETTFDFGTVNAGEIVEHTYKFKNVGKHPLNITQAKGSCGCTVPSYPKTPVAPGAEGEIKVRFDSKNKKGKRNQIVTITANTPEGNTKLNLTGMVNDGAGAAADANPIQITPTAAQ